jgi:hypothetical protein
MKKVRNYSTELDARLACDFLRSNDLNAEVRGAKEYASHLTGNDHGAYELFVDDGEFGQAITLLNEIEKSANDQATPIDSSLYFRKAMIAAVFAMVLLPVIFNIASLRNLALYRKAETDHSKKLVRTIIILVAQIPAVVLLYFLSNSYLKNISF